MNFIFGKLLSCLLTLYCIPAPYTCDAIKMQCVSNKCLIDFGDSTNETKLEISTFASMNDLSSFGIIQPAIVKGIGSRASLILSAYISFKNNHMASPL